mmetsp:Transcript_1029/g.1871  ORF Transcript_1029/g.1871 Transcript_1029/m.1871 type:complete len:129 (+) Transcript_1029:417-803(+)
MNLEEDHSVRMLIKKEFGFEQVDPYPCLYIDSSDDKVPNMNLSSSTAILNHLKDLEFIADFKSHSAKEAQTYADFIEAEVEPLMWELMRPFKTKFRFFANPRHFRQVELEWEVSDFRRLYSAKFMKTI